MSSLPSPASGNVDHFGAFELDHAAGELRLDGRAIPLQPRVFGVLAFLVENRARVVGKEELLSALWPGVIVTDASLQRAISLARTALREGGLDSAIRTYSRRGYRFCADSLAMECNESESSSGALTEARDAFTSRNWNAATEKYEQADDVRAVSAEELESWGTAALCAGRLLAAVTPLERSAAEYSAKGNKECSARTILLLSRIQLELGELDVAKACLRRARSLLEDLPTGVQHGHLAWMNARVCLADGDFPLAVEHAGCAISLGTQLGNLDLETTGKLLLGMALQASGNTRDGLELQGDAAAAVSSGNVSPLIGGLVYCGLISGYYNAGELRRAAQWIDSFSRWCERNNIQLFQGSCVLHRAELYAARGELQRAHAEIVNGAEVLRVSAPWAIGDAQRLIGDLHLARGEFEQAETAYRNAHEHGSQPYPGYAMLLHYRGQSAAALRGLRRAAGATHWAASENRGNYLAHLVTIAALSGDLACAGEVLAELDAHPDAWSTGATKAHVCRARGEWMLAQDKWDEATGWFHQAIESLLAVDACLDAAAVRLRLAECMARAGDQEGAEIELLAARKPFEDAGARFYLEMCMAQQESLARRS